MTITQKLNKANEMISESQWEVRYDRDMKLILGAQELIEEAVQELYKLREQLLKGLPK